MTNLAIGCLAAAAIALLSAPGAAQTFPQPARIAVRNGRFVEKNTGKQFVPLGVNYFRVTQGIGHSAFCPGSYDPAYVERMMADLAAQGFNTVRTFLSYHVGKNGILTSPEAREISPGYLDNMVHFLDQARRHGIHVIFTWDAWMPNSEWLAGTPLPEESKYSFLADKNTDMGLNGFRMRLKDVRVRANIIARLIEAVRRRDPGLLPVVMSWELENELYYIADKAPFNARAGTFAFAGKTYDMASDEQVQSLLDDVTVQWVNACAGAIHKADPDALVGAGVYTFAAVGRGGPGTLSKDGTKDSRIPARPLALLRSRLDYIDIHLYAWGSDTKAISDSLAHSLASDEWEKLQPEARKAGKPIMCGEFGAPASQFRKAIDSTIDHEMGLRLLREHLRGIKSRNFAGALYWHYGNPASTLTEEFPVIALFPQYGKVIRDVWETAPHE